jgi:hypothetical protein
MSSSDSNTRDDLWEQHYRRASERRRARGWHRRENTHSRGKRAARRGWLYAGAVFLFVALTAVALVLPR